MPHSVPARAGSASSPLPARASSPAFEREEAGAFAGLLEGHDQDGAQRSHSAAEPTVRHANPPRTLTDTPSETLKADENAAAPAVSVEHQPPKAPQVAVSGAPEVLAETPPGGKPSPDSPADTAEADATANAGIAGSPPQPPITAASASAVAVAAVLPPSAQLSSDACAAPLQDGEPAPPNKEGTAASGAGMLLPSGDTDNVSKAAASLPAEPAQAVPSARWKEARLAAPEDKAAGASSLHRTAADAAASTDATAEGRGPETADTKLPAVLPHPTASHAPSLGHAAVTLAASAASAAPLGTPVASAGVPPTASESESAIRDSVPVAGLAVAIAARAAEGKRRFEVRLDPPDLGRIDVRLDIDRDGQVTSRLVVERAETLDLLRRDAQGLQQALQSAGLRTDGSGLHFSLRDHSGAPGFPFQPPPPPKLLIVPDSDVAVREAVRRGYGVLRGLGRGIDIRV